MQPITNMSVVEGGNESLYCNTTGVPDPTVTWSGDVNKVIMRRWLNITTSADLKIKQTITRYTNAMQTIVVETFQE